MTAPSIGYSMMARVWVLTPGDGGRSREFTVEADAVAARDAILAGAGQATPPRRLKADPADFLPSRSSKTELGEDEAFDRYAPVPWFSKRRVSATVIRQPVPVPAQNMVHMCTIDQADPVLEEKNPQPCGIAASPEKINQPMYRPRRRGAGRKANPIDAARAKADYARTQHLGKTAAAQQVGVSQMRAALVAAGVEIAKPGWQNARRGKQQKAEAAIPPPVVSGEAMADPIFISAEQAECQKAAALAHLTAGRLTPAMLDRAFAELHGTGSVAVFHPDQTQEFAAELAEAKAARAIVEKATGGPWAPMPCDAGPAEYWFASIKAFGTGWWWKVKGGRRHGPFKTSAEARADRALNRPSL